MRKISVLILGIALIFSITSCKSNKSKLAGKWQVARANVHSPDWQKEWDDNAQKMDIMDKGGAGYDYSLLKRIEDTLLAIQKDEDGFYMKSTYQFNSDGSVKIKRANKEINGTWDLQQGKENMYVEIMDGSKRIENWYLYNDELSTPQFEQDHKFEATLCDGQLDRVNGYYVDLSFEKATE